MPTLGTSQSEVPTAALVFGALGTVRGTVGSAVSAKLTAQGGTGPITYTASGVPAGLTVSSAGMLSGRPVHAGTYRVLVTASAGSEQAVAFVNVVVSKGRYVPVRLRLVRQGRSYAVKVAAWRVGGKAGAVAKPAVSYQWSTGGHKLAGHGAAMRVPAKYAAKTVTVKLRIAGSRDAAAYSRVLKG